MKSRARFQRVATWLAVGMYAILASGLPLPDGGMVVKSGESAAKRLAGKDRSTPFPCMNKPCGCATAEQCFTSCCCHTPAETLAWARANKVDPAVITALQRRVAVAAKQAEPSCCEAASCCAVKASCCEAPEPPIGKAPAEPSDEPDSSRGVSLRAMLACGGIVAEWFSCGGSLPPATVALVTGLECIESLPCIDESASPLRAAPDLPPPRMG